LARPKTKHILTGTISAEATGTTSHLLTQSPTAATGDSVIRGARHHRRATTLPVKIGVCTTHTGPAHRRPRTRGNSGELACVVETENGHTSSRPVPSQAKLGHWFPFGPRFLVINDALLARWLKLMLITFLARSLSFRFRRIVDRSTRLETT
jgi:hypothetical protein